jgi:hypothetical protein
MFKVGNVRRLIACGTSGGIAAALRGGALAMLCALASCVEAGSLEDKDEFRRLLGLDDGTGDPGDGGTSTGGSSGGGGASGSGGGGRAGGGSGNGGGGAPAAGCPEACEIIATRCATAGCHAAGAMPAGMLDLGSDDLVGRLSGMSATTAQCSTGTLIDTASPEESVLYGKLLDPPSCGGRMPLGLPLSDEEIECFRKWINAPSCGDGAAGAGGMNAGAGGRSGAGGRGGQGGQGGAGMPGGTSVWIEAEMTGTLTAPLDTGEDAMASGGEFLVFPLVSAMPMAAADPGDAPEGIASYIFNVAEAGSYKIWGRVRVASGETDSWYVRVDGGTWYQWNNIPIGTEWHWDDVHDTGAMDAVVEFDLTAGQHTLNVARREEGSELDKILITDDADFVPMGEGG